MENSRAEALEETLPESGPSRPKKRKKKIDKGATVFLVVMLSVPICHWFVFWLYVNINSIKLAFQLPDESWTLNNFKMLFYELSVPDSKITVAIKNTFIYFCNSMFIIMPLSLILSYFFYKKIFLYKQLRVVLYLPAIISAVALTSAFANIIAPSGPVGVMLEKMGVDPVPKFLSDARYATWAMVFYCTWTGVGTGTLLFQGAMARIPTDVLEAARLDGCRVGSELIHIVFPLILPTVSTQIMLLMTGLFNASGPILLLTNGEHETTTIAFWIFYEVKFNGSLNNVSAAGLFFTAIGVPVILLVRWLLERIPAVEY